MLCPNGTVKPFLVCVSTSSLNWLLKGQLKVPKAAKIYASLTGWTFGFGASLDAGYLPGPDRFTHNRPIPVRLSKRMEIKWIVVFVSFGVALNLLIAGATGRVYDFWSGRRGSGKMVADLKSPSLRIVFSCLGAIFLPSPYFWRYTY
jgi:hypothetical protein